MPNEGQARLLTRAQVREVDRLAIEELGIPGIVLMENAAINVAVQVLDVVFESSDMTTATTTVSILCGGGNNGGDGYAIARHLHSGGMEVSLFTTSDPQHLRGDAATNYHICQRMGLPIIFVMGPADLEAAATHWARSKVIVDALLGTGFTGEVRQPVAGVIQRINQLHGPTVVAVDVPSGLDCDTGKPSNATVKADVTVTFVAPKVGFMTDEANTWLGELVVVDIGAPPELIQQAGE